MLSRLALRSAQVMPVAVRGVQTTAVASSSNLPRPKRPIDPAPVRHGFIPEEWFTFMYPKTGATGPYMLAASVGTYLLSKEIYVLNHEFCNGLSLLIIALVGINKLGPKVAAFLDKKVDEYEQECNAGRESEIQMYINTMEQLEKEKLGLEGQKMVIDIKKQNILMQLEAAYRQRLALVHNEVKKRLEFHLQVDTIERRIAQKHMVQWIINNVLKSITPEQEKANLQQCISDLQALAVKA